MARIFKINENMEIVCDSVGTQYGFRHDARLFVDGCDVEKAKICYYNRTWERFEFESVIMKLIDQTDRLTEAQKKQFRENLHP